MQPVHGSRGCDLPTFALTAQSHNTECKHGNIWNIYETEKKKKKKNQIHDCVYEEKQLRTQSLAHLWEGFRIQGGKGKRHPGLTTSENDTRASQLQKTTPGPHNFRKRHPGLTTSENDTRASQLQKTTSGPRSFRKRHLGFTTSENSPVSVQMRTASSLQYSCYPVAKSRSHRIRTRIA